MKLAWFTPSQIDGNSRAEIPYVEIWGQAADEVSMHSPHASGCRVVFVLIKVIISMRQAFSVLNVS